MNSKQGSAGNPEISRARRNRRILWLFVIMWLTVVIAPIPGYFLTDTVQAKGEFTENPRSNYWREVRQGTSGYSAVKGEEAELLINNAGNNWRAFRMGPMATYGAWLMGLVILAVLLLYFIGGPMKMKESSGKTVKRWTQYDIILHWVVAASFFALALSGLVLLYGRAVLIPVFGKDGFAALAQVMKDSHNVLGPFFSVALVMMMVPWIKDHLFIGSDVEWFKDFGGMLPAGAGKEKKYPPSGRSNAGQKAWYWLLAIGGVVLIVSGFLLIFPYFDQTRNTMILMHVLHSISGLVLIAVAMGHAYMGSIGVEGAFDSMVTGEVDLEWIRERHSLWYDELTQSQESSD